MRGRPGASLLLSLLLACTHQGGAPYTHRAPLADVGLRMAGQSVFRYETFGNEQFFSDVLGLRDGIGRLGVTPNDLLQTGLQLDVDKLPSEFRAVEVGKGPYADPAATRRLMEANAVLGLVARGGRLGVTCALCHSRADDRLNAGVGRRLDGVPNARLAFGEVLAWGDRSRAYLPFVNISGVGREPVVDHEPGTSEQRLEEQVDAALRAWPRGQADMIPDGVGNPTDFPAMFAVQPHGRYLWDGSFARARDAHQYFAAMALDPTTLATPAGRAFLIDGPFWPVGETLSEAYQGVLLAIDPEQGWPRATIFRASVWSLFHDPLDLRFRVNRDDIEAVTAYLGGVMPPEPERVDPLLIDAGRRVFRSAGCGDCHLEAPVAGGAVVPLATLMVGYDADGDGSGDRASLVRENPRIGYDDRIALTPGEDSIARRGYKVPPLLGLWLTAPYLHDGSVSTLHALFSPERGTESPHPFFVGTEEERQALVGFLSVWDGRRYP